MSRYVRPLLEARGLSKSFEGLRAVNGVSFVVAPGMIKAIIGPNGAGKTTLLNLITRLEVPTTGEVLFDGARIDRLPAHRIVRLGIARTFQNPRLFGEMSVLENVMVGRHARSGTGMAGAVLRSTPARAEEHAIFEAALRLLAEVDLVDRAHQAAASLPFGKQRLLEIARALASEPRLLLLDEPAAGLNTQEAAELGTFIRRIRSSGVTVVLVEHHIQLVMEISDEVMVLNFGAKLAEGPSEEIWTRPEVIKAYLGDEATVAHDLRA